MERSLPQGGKLPKDPWKRDYNYKYPGQNAEIDIFSYGQNGSRVVKVRTPTSITGTRVGGFTLVEVCGDHRRWSDTGTGGSTIHPLLRVGQFRASVREVITLLNSARHAAVAEGVAQDVVISPQQKLIVFGDQRVQFEQDVRVAAHSARRSTGTVRALCSSITMAAPVAVASTYSGMAGRR